MRRMHSRITLPVVVTLGLLCSLGNVGSAQENEAEREKVERVADVLAALGVRDGAIVADVGSSDGFYALRIARAVAPLGRSLAVDIDEKALARLRERAERDAITNVQTIVGAADDPKLPEGEVDAVLIRNAYHEMPEHRRVLEGVRRGLKAGGTLIVIEAIHDNNRALSRDRQVKEHELSAELVEAELRGAGFEILEIVDPFTKFSRPSSGGFWMIRARKRDQQGPATSPLGPLEPFLGRWEGISEGQPGKGTVEREYTSVLNSRFVRLTNRNVYPPQDRNPKGEKHEDIGIFSFDRARKRIVFRQFHVEGFVNQYVQEEGAPGAALIFVTEAIENIPSGWRARETYTFYGPDEFEEVFELAPVGKPFELYSRARLKRVK